MPGKLTDEQSAILIASAHRLDELSSVYLAEELRSVLRALLAPTQQPSGEATDIQWWLAELDQYGNPKLFRRCTPRTRWRGQGRCI
ncbi:hypothetical protein UA18_03480 [Burkholderia multivorans]|uniref:Uncharacterized protein n=2 Tax=Burkholderia multivorans TaxID=87883 RepID=A0ABD7L6M2_9BURK|nr:hypothetical protein UA18_03480 [Burkholderia multivorans]